MRLAGLLVVLACAVPAQAQPPPELDKKKDEGADKQQNAPQSAPQPPLPPKPRPRISLKPKGGTGSNVGDDAPGGGATTAEPSKGGTPGTPSGSFTGPPTRP